MTGPIVTSHGSSANSKLCATCHVESFPVTDLETGDFVFNATGHLFKAIPCLDAKGIPQNMDCEVTTTARRFTGCTGSNCHTTEATALSAFNAGTASTNRNSNDLLGLINQVDSDWTGGSGGSIDPDDDSLTAAEGALFNYNLAIFGDPIGVGTSSETNVGGSTVHNSFLMTSLLIASIDMIKDVYGVSTVATQGINYNARLREFLETIGQPN